MLSLQNTGGNGCGGRGNRRDGILRRIALLAEIPPASADQQKQASSNCTQHCALIGTSRRFPGATLFLFENELVTK